MRILKDHIVSEDQASQLEISVTDAPGAGGANHRYQIDGFDATENPSSDPIYDGDSEPVVGEGYRGPIRCTILFQNGPIKEAGVNGVTQEALLAVVIDRLRSFQAGPFSCRENALALTNCEQALMWLQKRTLDRLRRGVEGTHAA
jgi:hypothetical protein